MEPILAIGIGILILLIIIVFFYLLFWIRPGSGYSIAEIISWFIFWR